MLEFLIDDDGNMLVNDLPDDLKNLISNIAEFVNASDLEDTFILKVLKRLEAFGYEFKENTTDHWLIAFAINRVISHVKTVTNNSDIDSNLIPIIMDRVCGEFLFSKSKTGQLSEMKLDFDAVAKQVQIGDTSITYAIGDGTATDEQKLDTLISYLRNEGEDEILCYRKIKW